MGFQCGVWRGASPGFHWLCTQMTLLFAEGVPLLWQWRGGSAIVQLVTCVHQRENALYHFARGDMYIALEERRCSVWTVPKHEHFVQSLIDQSRAQAWTWFCVQLVIDSPIFCDLITDSWRSCRRKKWSSGCGHINGVVAFCVCALGDYGCLLVSASWSFPKFSRSSINFPSFRRFLLGLVGVWWLGQDAKVWPGGRIGRKAINACTEAGWTENCVASAGTTDWIATLRWAR